MRLVQVGVLFESPQDRLFSHRAQKRARGVSQTGVPCREASFWRTRGEAEAADSLTALLGLIKQSNETVLVNPLKGTKQQKLQGRHGSRLPGHPIPLACKGRAKATVLDKLGWRDKIPT